MCIGPELAIALGSAALSGVGSALNQREQQKNQTAAKIAEFSGFCNLSCASSHGCLLSDH